MPIQARYWYEHIAFVLGIKKRDAVEPGEGVKPLAQAFAELLDDGGLDEKPAVDVPQWLIQLSAAQGKVGIDSLTQDEFDKATTLMDSLYKMSARRDNLYVVNDGAKLKDVVDELCEHMDVVPELKRHLWTGIRSPTRSLGRCAMRPSSSGTPLGHSSRLPRSCNAWTGTPMHWAMARQDEQQNGCMTACRKQRTRKSS